MLPGGIDGLHILETLRGRKNAVPVLILSALAEDDERDVIDGLVRNLVRGVQDRATNLLRQRRETLDKTARAPLERETLTADELTVLLAGVHG
jgi:DNA-binding response OmpR family regulator